MSHHEEVDVDSVAKRWDPSQAAELDLNNTTRVRLHGGRNVHSMLRVGDSASTLYRTGCWAYYVGPGNHLLANDAEITCRKCQRTEAGR